MRRYLTLAVVVLACLLAVSLKRCSTLRADRDRLASNQSALLDAATYYETKAGASAASVERLELTRRELETHRADLVRTCDELRVKVRRLEAASTTATVTEIEAVAPLRDTVIIIEQQPVAASAFNWADAWVSVSGLIRDERVECRVRSVDTLVQLVHRVPRKFLFIRWGCKAIRQEIVSKNPHTRIVYAEYIELKK